MRHSGKLNEKMKAMECEHWSWFTSGSYRFEVICGGGQLWRFEHLKAFIEHFVFGEGFFYIVYKTASQVSTERICFKLNKADYQYISNNLDQCSAVFIAFLG